jgi:hypothetical protein
LQSAEPQGFGLPSAGERLLESLEPKNAIS